MGSQAFDSSKKILADVEAGQRVTLQLHVTITFALPETISELEEVRGFERLMNSSLRHEVADDLERIWLGERQYEPVAATPPEPAQAHEPDSAPAAGERRAPPPFSPNRRGSQAPRTPQQQIVVHLEGPRFGFDPSRRDERLAFTSWLAGLPNLLTSTNDLSTGQVQTVLQDIATARDPAGLVQQWQDSGLNRPPAPPPTSILDEPLGF